MGEWGKTSKDFSSSLITFGNTKSRAEGCFSDLLHILHIREKFTVRSSIREFALMFLRFAFFFFNIPPNNGSIRYSRAVVRTKSADFAATLSTGGGWPRREREMGNQYFPQGPIERKPMGGERAFTKLLQGGNKKTHVNNVFPQVEFQLF